MSLLLTLLGQSGGSGTGNGWVQSVQTLLSTNNTTSVTAGTWVTIPGMSVTITPTSSSNKIMILSQLNASSDFSTTFIGQARLVRGSTAIDVSSVPLSSQVGASVFIPASVSANFTSTVPITFIDTPATTSPITYSLQFTNSQTSTMYVNRTPNNTNTAGFASYASTLIAIEVSS